MTVPDTSMYDLPVRLLKPCLSDTLQLETGTWKSKHTEVSCFQFTPGPLMCLKNQDYIWIW